MIGIYLFTLARLCVFHSYLVIFNICFATWKFLPGANRRTVVRLVSAVEPHCFCDSNPKIKNTPFGVFFYLNWLRSVDLNHRPSGYEPDELPDCSTPR